MAGECNQQFLVSNDVIQDAGQEMPLPGGGANFRRSQAGQGQEPPEPLLILGYEAKRLNRQDFRYLNRERFLPGNSHLFAFP